LRRGVKVQRSGRGRRRRRGWKRDGGRDGFLIMMTGRLRRRDQHRRAFGGLRYRLLGGKSGDGDSRSRLSGHGRHLRLHHGLTVTLGAKAHGSLAAEEATHVLAHHRALGSLGGCFLGHTLGGHLEEENNPTNHAKQNERSAEAPPNAVTRDNTPTRTKLSKPTSSQSSSSSPDLKQNCLCSQPRRTSLK